MKKAILPVVFFLVAVFIFALYWFGFRQNKPSNTSDKPLVRSSMRLKWLHQAQFAGNYVAVEKGFYQNEGIRMELSPIDLTENTIDLVAEGRIDFGISGADDLILARARGKKVKAVAVIYKINPAGAVSLEKSMIKKPEDLIGKKVGIQKGNPIEYLFDAMMGGKKIALDKITKVEIGYDAKEVLDGTVDVALGYITNEPNMIAKNGQKPSSLLFADFGVDMYADVLITSDKLIETNPDLVRGVVKATIDGWKYAIEHEKEAVEMTLKYAKKSTEEHEAFMLSTSIPLIHTGGSKLGVMTEKGWETAQDILLRQKLLKNKVETSLLYEPKFVNAVYAP